MHYGNMGLGVQRQARQVLTQLAKQPNIADVVLDNNQ